MSLTGAILITGATSFWGAALVNNLLMQEQYHVIGIDHQPPVELNPKLDFIQADIRNPAIAELLKTENVHTVCHLAFKEQHTFDTSTYDFNVKGSINLLRACVVAGVQKVILKSSTVVYGARPSNPSFLKEDHPLHGSRTSAYIQELVELENYLAAFSRRTPDIKCTILRFANIIGPHATTPLNALLGSLYPVSILGFNPQFQLIHENDVIEALSFAIRERLHGVYNIAADGILPLHKIIGLSGKIRLPVMVPFAYWSAKLRPELNRRLFYGDPDYLRFSIVGDVTRMKAEMGFTPQYSAEAAISDLKAQLEGIAPTPEEPFPSEEVDRLRATIVERQTPQDQPNEDLDKEPISQEGA